jgi:transcriptional regulator with XRE-family HTH domain
MQSGEPAVKKHPEGIANKIKMVRESSNLSQDYMAAKLNISQQAYSRIEKTPDNITIKRLRQISEVLGVPFTTLAGEEDMYIQQNFNQQGGQAGSVVYVQGLAETERKAYENHIQDLKKQIDMMKELLLAQRG